MKRSKTKFRGGEALRLTTRQLELVVTTAVGPRVVSFRPTGTSEKNVFLEFPADEKRYLGYMLRGGHRLWHSPEHIPRTYQPDDDPVEVKVLPTGVRLVQPVESKTGIQKSVALEFLDEDSVKVTHTLTNRGQWAVETAPWALTMLQPGGYGVLPLPPKGSHAAGDLLPNYAIVPWTYTNLALPVWQWHKDFVGIDVGQAREAQKLGITFYPGWSAYWIGGMTFVKYAHCDGSAVYPDKGCAFETFTNGEMIEFETLGPIGFLKPDSSFEHIEYWTIFRGLPRPDDAEKFMQLAKKVSSWKKSF